jgi:hypothetical protein
MKFVALIPVGPKKKELERLGDLLASLFYFEAPEECGLLLINDGNSRTRLQEMCGRYNLLHCHILENPRAGRGEGWSDGLTVGILAGLRWVVRQMPPAKFVLKLDTDSLVIAPLFDKVEGFFQRQAKVGMIGSHLQEPGGAPTTSIRDWAPRIKKLQRPFTIWKSKNRWHFQFGFWGRDRRIRKLIADASDLGYVFGESCLGGAYALSATALQKLNGRGLLDDSFLFINRRITEDIVVGLFTRLVNLQLANFNAQGEPFGVTWRGLCASPAELLRSGYSIIHSVKDAGTCLETETRAYFAEHRTTLNNRDKSQSIAS